MSILLSALVLGFMGSFHCAGMCGPIAIALPLQGNTIPGKILGGPFITLAGQSHTESWEPYSDCWVRVWP